MSETEADRAFYQAGEAAFVRRRGTPFLLSPRDFALLKQWRMLGVPIEAVEQGIDDAFSRREERGATGRINSLSYCRDAVLSAWERRAASAVGRGAGQEAAPDTAAALEELERRLLDIEKRRADLAEPLAAARRSLARLAKGSREPAAVEESLARLDRRLAAALHEALPESERREIEEGVARQLAGLKDRMDDETALRTAKALTRRQLRQKLDLPRLSLL